MKHNPTFIKSLYSKAFFILAFMCSAYSFSQVEVVGGPYTVEHTDCEFPAIFNPNNEQISIPSAVSFSEGSRGSFCSIINVNYNGFTPEAEAAFQYAVDIWANTLSSTVPITIEANYVSLNPGVLGSAGPSNFYQITGPDILPSTIYPSALAEKLIGQELGGANSIDVFCNFSNNTPWYFGTDANPPNNEFDFVSVVLHELGHGLGFIGFARTVGNQGALRNQSFLSPYDNFVENNNFIDIDIYDDPSEALLTQFTGGNLFVFSPLAVAANGGVRPEIWAPNNFNPSSSYSHWDDFVFPNNNVNSLMTPSIGNGQANHNTGPITRGLFEEMGWTVCEALSVNEFALDRLQITPNPFTDALRITLPGTYADSDFNISIIDVNGRTVFEKETMSNNNRIDLNVAGLEKAVYFMQIKDTTTGLSVTKKIVR